MVCYISQSACATKILPKVQKHCTQIPFPLGVLKGGLGMRLGCMHEEAFPSHCVCCEVNQLGWTISDRPQYLTVLEQQMLIEMPVPMVPSEYRNIE